MQKKHITLVTICNIYN